VVTYVDILYLFQAGYAEPDELADTGSMWVEGQKATYLTLEFSTLSVTCSPSVGLLSLQQRQCRFHSESNLAISPRFYSFNLCRINCRRQLALHLCGCSPHFYNNNGKHQQPARKLGMGTSLVFRLWGGDANNESQYIPLSKGRNV